MTVEPAPERETLNCSVVVTLTGNDETDLACLERANLAAARDVLERVDGREILEGVDVDEQNITEPVNVPAGEQEIVAWQHDYPIRNLPTHRVEHRVVAIRVFARAVVAGWPGAEVQEQIERDEAVQRATRTHDFLTRYGRRPFAGVAADSVRETADGLSVEAQLLSGTGRGRFLAVDPPNARVVPNYFAQAARAAEMMMTELRVADASEVRSAILGNTGA